MDVINLSLGEPEIEPSRDIVVEAIDAAADAGVVPVVAAGNDFDELRRTARSARPAAPPRRSPPPRSTEGRRRDRRLLVERPDAGLAADEAGRDRARRRHRSRRCRGARAVGALQRDEHGGAARRRRGGAAAAAPPGWTVAQIKSALVPDRRRRSRPVERARSPTTREGGGLDRPRRAPTTRSSSPPRPASRSASSRAGRRRPRAVALTDAGGGAGAWTVAIAAAGDAGGVIRRAARRGDRPGLARGHASPSARRARRATLTGFVVLTRGGDSRRIPYWLHVERPQLGREPHGDAREDRHLQGQHRAAAVARRRLPLPGDAVRARRPERSLRGPGAGVPRHARAGRSRTSASPSSRGRAASASSRASSRAGDENRLDRLRRRCRSTSNPYLAGFGAPAPVVGARSCRAPGAYDVVFDTPTGARPGAFTFRFWIDDMTPPAVRLLTRLSRRARRCGSRSRTPGSGVDPATLCATRRRHRPAPSRWRARRATVGAARCSRPAGTSSSSSPPTSRRSKNNENVARDPAEHARAPDDVRVR